MGSSDTGQDVFGSIETVIDNIIGGILILEVRAGDHAVKPLYINDGFYRMLGYGKKEAEILFKNMMANIVVEDRTIVDQAITDVLKDDGSVEVEFRTVTKDGGIRWLQVRANLFSRDADRSVCAAMMLDATERKNMEEEWSRQAERMSLLSEVEGEHILDYNAKTDALIFKTAHDSGYQHDIVRQNYIERGDFENIYFEDKEKLQEIMKDALKSPKRDSVDIRIKLFDDEYRWYRLVISSIMGNEGYVTRVVGRITDIHSAKLKELELEVKAEIDLLTGVFNRGATEQLIMQSLKEEQKENSSRIHAFMELDLDNFKAINDHLGHAYGDLVLSETAEKLKNMFKGRDIVGRFGGDEFIIFMYDIEDIRNAGILAGKLCRMIQKSYPCVDGDINVTASIGIAVCKSPFMEYQELFDIADKALYTTKNNGKNGYTIYTDDTQSS
ncbi:MAG: diguanylate cyclase [bacterium]|nr:diguanylate cyclase [bacterium]